MRVMRTYWDNGSIGMTLKHYTDIHVCMQGCECHPNQINTT